MIEVMFAIRKDGFKDHPVVQDGLDLVDEEDQFTHMLPLDDEYDPEDLLSESRWQGRDSGSTQRRRSRKRSLISDTLTLWFFLSDVFKMDPDFLENEEKYKTIKRGESETVRCRRQFASNQIVSFSLTNRVSPPGRYPGRRQQRLRGGGRRQRRRRRGG